MSNAAYRVPLVPLTGLGMALVSWSVADSDGVGARGNAQMRDFLAAHGIDGMRLALIAQRAENGYVGVMCGIMDQFASSLSTEGHALHIWCNTMETKHVPFARSVLIFDTAVPRSLRNSDFNTRRRECTEALTLLREKDPSLENLASAGGSAGGLHRSVSAMGRPWARRIHHRA